MLNLFALIGNHFIPVIQFLAACEHEGAQDNPTHHFVCNKNTHVFTLSALGCDNIQIKLKKKKKTKDDEEEDSEEEGAEDSEEEEQQQKEQEQEEQEQEEEEQQ